MLIYWVPLIVVLLLRTYRSHSHRQFFREGDDGFVTFTPLWESHPALDRVLAVASGRTAVSLTVLFGLFTVATLVVALAALPAGATPDYCLHHVWVP
jgi:hypothetical protein